MRPPTHTPLAGPTAFQRHLNVSRLLFALHTHKRERGTKLVTVTREGAVHQTCPSTLLEVGRQEVTVVPVSLERAGPSGRES